MSTHITYDPKTREIEQEQSLHDRRYLIYVWGEEGQGYLTQAKFGDGKGITVCDDPDPKKGMRMPLKKALGLLARLDEVGFKVNLVCFPEVTVWT